MRAAVVVGILVQLAACDRVFGLREIEQHADAALSDAAAPGDLSGDASEDKLLAWYTFDALEPGMVFVDESGHANDATCTSCPASVAGKHGNAAHFDGTSTMARAAAAPLVTRDGFTVALWMYAAVPPTGVSCMASFVRGTAAADSWQLCLDTKKLVFTIDNGPLATVVVSPTPAGTSWHHIAARWDASGAAALLVDGVVRSTSTQSAAPLFEDGVFAIGGDVDNDAAQSVFSGDLDDLRLYSRALSDPEISVLAQ